MRDQNATGHSIWASAYMPLLVTVVTVFTKYFSIAIVFKDTKKVM